MLFLMSGLATAAVELTSGLTNGAVIVDVSYEALGNDDDDTTHLEYTKTLTFLNNGNESTIINLAITSVATDYTFTLSRTAVTIAAGASESVTLTSRVPIDEDSGLSGSLGKLTVRENSLELGNYDLKTNVEAMLEMKEIAVYIDGTKEETINDDDKMEKVRPGKELELRFKIKNLFDEDYQEGDIDSIELNVEFADEDDEDDFGASLDEQPQDSFDSLDANDEASGEEVVIIISIPSDAEENDYNLIVNLEGEDGNGAAHTTQWELVLPIERENDDVQFDQAALEKSTLTCGESTNLNIVLTNYGSNDQKKTGLVVYNAELDLNENYQNLYLDSDPDNSRNSYSVKIPIVIDETVKPKDYHIDVRSFIKGDDEVEYKDVKLTVTKCVPAEEEDTLTAEEQAAIIAAEEAAEQADNVDNTAADEEEEEVTTETTADQITGSTIYKVVEEPYTSEDFFIATIIIALVLILAMIIIFVVLLIR